MAELWFAMLKRERLPSDRWLSVDNMQSRMIDYIEGLYNTRRLHSPRGNVSPTAYEKQLTAA